MTPVSSELLEAIETYPTTREATHCGSAFRVSSLAIYGVCPVCGTKVKLRSFSGQPELEDIFDAVFSWMQQPGALETISERRREIEAVED